MEIKTFQMIKQFNISKRCWECGVNLTDYKCVNIKFRKKDVVNHNINLCNECVTTLRKELDETI